jgi:hypothetical protein
MLAITSPFSVPLLTRRTTKLSGRLTPRETYTVANHQSRGRSAEASGSAPFRLIRLTTPFVFNSWFGAGRYFFGSTTLTAISLLETVVFGTFASSFTTFSSVVPVFSISKTLPCASPTQNLVSALSVE